MEDTDNFAYIIKVRADRDDRIRLQEERWREWDKAQERQRPWVMAIGFAFLIGLCTYCYFNP
jgi:hypothetical protein